MSRRAALALWMLVLPVSAEAVVQAHFRVESLNGGCAVDDEDPWPLGDPERYFRMAVFDGPSTSILNACAAGCTDDGAPATLDGRTLDYCSYSTGCGFFDFADQTITKTIPNGSGAYFYFGLFDDDDLDSDDSLGDHWQFRSGYSSTTVANQNNAPYYPGNPITAVCGDPVEDLGSSGNYSFTHRIWFSDTDGPTAPPGVVHRDNGLITNVNDDSVLEFSWDAASDPHSGISGYRFWLYDATTGAYVFNNLAAPMDRTLFICPSGCDYAYTPVISHVYWFSVQSVNGAYPTLTTSTGTSATTGTPSAWITVVNGVLAVEDEPGRLQLARPFPNPSAGATTVSYTLPAAGTVLLEVLDLQGRRVRVLADGAAEAGSHHLDWDGRDEAGVAAGSGLYWLRLTAAGGQRTRRLAITR